MAKKSDKQKEFKSNQAAENAFARALKKVARHSGHIVEAHVEGSKIRNSAEMNAALEAYARLVEPWARRQSAKMLEKVAKKNQKAFKQHSKMMGRALKAGVAETEVGATAAKLMNEQVNLIKSIPTEAGARAQKLALEGFYNGTRSDEIAKELMRTTKVTESRAVLIARTETARANALITQARAQAIGAQAYYWRTTMDGAERDSHAKMNGKPVMYAKPPKLSDGTVGHAGTFPNCRCWQDPVFDDE